MAPLAPGTQNWVSTQARFLPRPITECSQNSSHSLSLLLPPPALIPTISSLSHYTRNVLIRSSWFPFSPAPTLPIMLPVFFLKQNLMMLLSCLESCLRIKCKILPRTYKVLYHLASDYLSCFIRGRGLRHISHEANRATWKFPNSASLSAQNAILSFAHLANSHYFSFFRPAQNPQFIMLFSEQPSHFASLL